MNVTVFFIIPLGLCPILFPLNSPGQEQWVVFWYKINGLGHTLSEKTIKKYLCEKYPFWWISANLCLEKKHRPQKRSSTPQKSLANLIFTDWRRGPANRRLFWAKEMVICRLAGHVNIYDCVQQPLGCG